MVHHVSSIISPPNIHATHRGVLSQLSRMLTSMSRCSTKYLKDRDVMVRQHCLGFQGILQSTDTQCGSESTLCLPIFISIIVQV